VSTDETIDSEFHKSYRRIGLKVAATLGYAVAMPAGTRLTPEERCDRVIARADRAFESLVEMQQWLVDDAAIVRQAARDGIRSLMFRAYTGDQSERAWRGAEKRHWADRAVERVLHRVVHQDGPEPWWHIPGRQVRTRKLAIAGAFFAALAAGAMLGTGHAVEAAPLVLLAAVLDIIDGAFARVVHMRDAHLRWLSCVASHAGDMLLVAGIAYGAEYGQLGSGYGGWLLGAAVVTLFGSLVRTSALQAGYRFWRSPLERYVRYGAVLIFCALSGAGRGAAGIVATTAILTTLGITETLRVLHGVEGMPAVQDGGIVFIDSEHEVHAFGISDDGEQSLWAPLDDAVDREELASAAR
jgi:hypothetical protein